MYYYIICNLLSILPKKRRNEKGDLHRMWILFSKEWPSSWKNWSFISDAVADFTTAEFWEQISDHDAGIRLSTMCIASLPFSVFTITTETPLSSSISGINELIPQKSPNVISLPLFSCLAGHIWQEGLVYKLAKKPRMKAFLLPNSEKTLPYLFSIMKEYPFQPVALLRNEM